MTFQPLHVCDYKDPSKTWTYCKNWPKYFKCIELAVFPPVYFTKGKQYWHENVETIALRKEASIRLLLIYVHYSYALTAEAVLEMSRGLKNANVVPCYIFVSSGGESDFREYSSSIGPLFSSSSEALHLYSRLPFDSEGNEIGSKHSQHFLESLVAPMRTAALADELNQVKFEAIFRAFEDVVYPRQTGQPPADVSGDDCAADKVTQLSSAWTQLDPQSQAFRLYLLAKVFQLSGWHQPSATAPERTRQFATLRQLEKALFAEATSPSKEDKTSLGRWISTWQHRSPGSSSPSPGESLKLLAELHEAAGLTP